MRVSWLLGAVVSLGLSTAGHAATISILSPGDLALPSGSGPSATFDAVSAEAYGSTSPFGSFSDGGASFSGSAVVMNNGGQASLGLYATPYGDTTNYMAVLGGGSEQIAYSSLKSSFGLYWGSVDTYNSLSFYSGDTLVATITGADVDPPMNANGGQTDYASNGYVWITALPQFDRVVAASGSNSFEFDNVAAGVEAGFPTASAAVPEPSTWAMLLIGFSGLGYAAFRRSKGPISALA
jgi:PEP-CTERM motif